MNETRTETTNLPQWLRGTHEEQVGLAGVCACYAGLFTLYALGLLLGLNWLLTLAVAVCAFLGTFHAFSSRLIYGAWPTLPNRLAGSSQRRSLKIAIAAVVVVGLCSLALLRPSGDSMSRGFSPGSYADSRKAELQAKDLWENRSESKDGKTRTIVLILLKDGKVVQDVVERTFATEGVETRMTGETLVWSKTVPSESQIVNFAVGEDGTSLFRL